MSLSRTRDATGQEGVWPANAPAVAAFCAVASQWRTALVPLPDGVRLAWIGFDYAAVRAGLEAEGIEITPALWRDIRVMEAAARDALNGM